VRLGGRERDPVATAGVLLVTMRREQGILEERVVGGRGRVFTGYLGIMAIEDWISVSE